MRYLVVLMVIYAIEGALLPLTCAYGSGNEVLPSCLVEAEVASTGELASGVIEVKLRITHIFWGNKEIEGKMFRVECRKSGEGSFYGTTGSLFPLPKVKEVSIWALTTDKGAVVADFSWFEPSLPCRKDISRGYPNVRKFADAVEQYGNTSSKSRRDFLMKRTRSETPEVSSWAIRMLGASDVQNNLALLRTLATPDVITPLAQITLDKVLVSADPSWQTSSERRRLLDSLMTRAYADAESALRVQDMLDMEAQRGTLDGAMLLDLMKLAIGNEKLPATARRNACRIVGFLAQRSTTNTEKSFEYLLQLTGGKDSKLAEDAALLIQHRVPLNKDRKEQIRKSAVGMNTMAAKVLMPLVEESRQPQ